MFKTSSFHARRLVNLAKRLVALAAFTSLAACGNCAVPAFHPGPTVSAVSCAQNAITGQGVPLGAAATFAVLASSTVTNSGPSIVTGDLGVSPGSAVTGFPPGIVTGGRYTRAIPPRPMLNSL